MIQLLGLVLLQSAVLCLIGFTIERVALADQNNTLRNIGFNCACAVLYFAGSITIGNFIDSSIGRLSFHGVVNLSLLSDGKSELLSVPLVIAWIAIKDFFYYWFHRLQHYSKWLWAEHELHHSEEHMNVTTAARHHWLEVALDNVFTLAPLLFLFRPPVLTTIAAAVIAKSFGYFIHLNSRMSLGPLNRIIANPSTHRIHHSKSPEHIDKNFAAFFPIWDVIFGTYVSPKRGEFPCTGLASGKVIDSPRAAILGPLIAWASMLKPHAALPERPH